jgi:hypothetical protein
MKAALMLGMCWEQTEQIDGFKSFARRPTVSNPAGGIDVDVGSVPVQTGPATPADEFPGGRPSNLV